MKKTTFSMGSLGAGLGLLLLYGIVYIFFYKTPATTEQVNAYIQNSEIVILKNIYFYDNKEMFRYARMPWRRNNTSKYKNVAMLQSPDSKKCFSLESYGKRFPLDIDKKILLRSPQLYLVVNKDDMKNPKLGTKEHPVVVLLWYTHPDNKFNRVSEQNYKYGVKEYLTYCREE